MSITTYVSDLVETFGITFDHDDNLYIANGNEQNIGKIDKEGNRTIFASGFNNTENVVFDNLGFPNGYLYFLDANKIYKVDVHGNITDFCSTKNGNYLGLTIDKDNNIYYSSSSCNIYKINQERNITLFIDGTGVLNFPNGIQFDKMGNLYVCNSGSDYISKYNSKGELINPRFIQYPGFNWFNLILDNNNETIYASFYDDTNDRNGINKYDMEGRFVSYIDREIGAFGLAIDSCNHLYYTDNTQTMIKKYVPPVVEKEVVLLDVPEPVLPEPEPEVVPVVPEPVPVVPEPVPVVPEVVPVVPEPVPVVPEVVPVVPEPVPVVPEPVPVVPEVVPVVPEPVPVVPEVVPVVPEVVPVVPEPVPVVPEPVPVVPEPVPVVPEVVPVVPEPVPVVPEVVPVVPEPVPVVPEVVPVVPPLPPVVVPTPPPSESINNITIINNNYTIIHRPVINKRRRSSLVYIER
jgi:hypothetical protein